MRFSKSLAGSGNDPLWQGIAQQVLHKSVTSSVWHIED